MNCTIVMYHYVRDLEKTRYPEINALRKSEFKYQLDYLEENYNFISVEECKEAIYKDKDLPANPVLLTFDDGFLDHYTTVFPILDKRDISGAFFPPAEPIMKDTLLNVHKIHFILANNTDREALLESVFDYLDCYRENFGLKSNEKYYQKLAEPGRWDPEEIVFIKRLLQRELSLKARSAIIDDLFNEYLNVDEEVLSQELYMKPDQLRTMINAGMHVGSHSYSHRWLGALSQEEQESEIDKSIDFLETIGASTTDWTMCYPYGSYDNTTLKILKETDCSIGFTTEVGEAHLNDDNKLTLERLDTNDLPQSPSDLD